MSKKTGRNDLCPCGSGKKFKKCCIGKISNKIVTKKKPTSEFEKIIKSFDKIDLLKTNAALQLLPINHGKNVRFEIFARDVITNSEEEKLKVTYSSLTTFFKNNFTSHYLEDPISSFFTENVIWFYGDFTVFPGLNLNGTKILNLFLESIFTQKNNLPESFRIEVRDGVMMILAMTESIAITAGLNRYEYEEFTDSRIQLPGETKLNHLKESVVFDNEHLSKITEHYGVDINALNHFVADPNDPNFQNDDPDKNPLLLQPIIKNGESEFIFALPTASVNCLTHFIRKQAIEKSCLPRLTNLFGNHQWNEAKQLLQETGWRETDIKLPETELGLRESIFRFDNDKLAYVCFIASNGIEDSTETEEIPEQEELQETLLPHEIRNKEVIDFLKDLNGSDPYRYFTLNIIGEDGQDMFFMYGKPESSNEVLTLKYGELEKLVFADILDGLSLWKFAKVYNRASSQSRISSIGGILDAFVSYQSNNESLLPSDTAIPDFMNFAIGNSNDFEREAIKKIDEHSALQQTNKHGLLSVPVRRMRDFAPIYKEREYSREHNLLIECFECSVWVRNNQANSQQEKETINHYSEAVIFWLYKMKDELQVFFAQFKRISPVEFDLKLAKELIAPSDIVPQTIEGVKLDFGTKIEKDKNTITIELPKEILSFFFRPDNNGEKKLMNAVLSGFNELQKQNNYSHLDENAISELIERHMQPSNAKMILYFDTTNELRLDNRGLVPYRSIQESEISCILDQLVGYLDLEEPIPEIIESIEEKNSLCNKIVSALVTKLISELEEFDTCELLKWLMELHEKCIQSREFKELHIPAKISCFSDFASEVEKLEKENHDLVATALSIRCIIEFIAAKPQFGTKWPNIDDYDRMLALMNQIINWGILSDSMDLGMDDPEMGLLPSGRIGTDKSFVETYIHPFSKAKAETTVYTHQENFYNKFKSIVIEETDRSSPPEEVIEINTAFENEWGIGLTEVLKLKRTLVEIAFEKEKSVVEMKEEELIKELSKKLSGFQEDLIKVGLDLITLSERSSIIKTPTGYNKEDIYPWKYNRSLSYLRKPLIKIKRKDGQVLYYWSFRHVLDSLENLQVLLFNGRLKAKKGGLLNDYLKKINNEKGKVLRDEVAKWLTDEGTLEIIPYEVKPSKLSGNQDDGKYGDVDILAIDKSQKVIFSIECKNTVSARVIHEMKTEMDKYLGRNEDSSWVHKHARRDTWLKDNIDLLSSLVDNSQEYSVVSLIMTSEDIPTTYLAQDTLPLPIISFPSLKRQGLKILIENNL